VQELSGLRVNDPIVAIGLEDRRDRGAEDGSRPGLAFVSGTQDCQILLFGGLAAGFVEQEKKIYQRAILQHKHLVDVHVVVRRRLKDDPGRLPGEPAIRSSRKNRWVLGLISA